MPIFLFVALFKHIFFFFFFGSTYSLNINKNPFWFSVLCLDDDITSEHEDKSAEAYAKRVLKEMKDDYDLSDQDDREDDY